MIDAAGGTHTLRWASKPPSNCSDHPSNHAQPSVVIAEGFAQVVSLHETVNLNIESMTCHRDHIFLL